MKESLSHFSGLYSLSKTLRFELIPQGKTLDYIHKNGLLSQDEHRADSYKLVKKIIDEYHKAFIEKALDGLELNLLVEYSLYYQIPKKEDSQKKQFEDIQTKMRKQISDKLTKNEKFKNLFGKELIKDDLQVFVQNVEERELVKEFEDFTTYFTGFHENRKNMYSDEEKSTAIAFRLIHQNLPKFIDNMRAFDKIRMSNLKEKFSHILSNSELGPIIQVLTIEDVFSLQYFNQTLTQIGIDKYNQLIGGYTSEDGATKIKGLNEYINLFNQNVKDKNQKLPKLKTLFKQILSDRSTASFIPQQYEDDNAVLESIEKLYQELNEHVFSKQIKGEHSLIELLQNLPEYDLSKIYVRNDTSLTDISQKLYGDWSVIQKALYIDYDQHYTGKKKLGTEQYEEERKKNLKQDSYSIAYLNSCLSLLPKEIELKNIETYFALLGKTETEPTLFDTLTKNYQEIKDLLNTPYPDNKNLAQQQVDVEKIKALLDSIKSIQWFIKPLLGKGNEAEKDERFYGEFASLWEVLDQITPIYNKVRNYMTRKPYSTEKIKLNFENSHFLNGWAQDYETKAGLIYMKNGNYYLGINNKKLTKEEKEDLKGTDAKRIILDFQKPDNKNIPRLFIRSKGENFAPAVEKYNLPIKDIIDIYDNGKFKTDYRKVNEIDFTKSLHKLIDYFKEGFTKHESYKHYQFSWKKTSEYKDIAEFYNDVEVSCYQVFEEDVNWDRLMSFVNEGKLYLFQIFNKDFSPYSKGTPNMHTLYWKMLFDEENLKDVVYKLNGQAEVFYRKASIKNENIVVHKANEAIKNKNEANEKKHSNFNYDLVKDKRYTVDKFQFHVPITMNFKGRGLNNINLEVNEHIRNNNDIHIIGIDRGERHLLYLTLIDGKGNIVEQYSLNEIINQHNGNEYRTNYHTLLDAREGNRDEERRNWKTIESIKELKEGYLSQVIHKISELMVKYNAIVVLEDLNAGFIRGRQKVEKSVYQQFEKMLIDKLNYLVDKKKSATELGGTLKALQLTNKFESFQKMGKQSGFLFYVPAWNTSKIDPVTGFVNFLYTKYENIDKTKTFFKKFKDIRYNSEKGYFEFVIDNYTQFNPKAEGTRQNWTICSYGTRIETFRNADKNNQWDNREINITAEFMKLFGNTTRISEMISQQNDKSFFERLMHLLKLTLQMRNSITNTEIDYLISPVADENGVFFDSRNIDINAGKPMNADANGAFNIARKGLWVIQQIKNPATDLKKIKLAITNKEWLQFVQS